MADKADQSEAVLSTTQGTCPVCVKMVDANVVESCGKVYLEKNCPDHGKNRALISNDSAYYKNLADYFFDIMDKSQPQRDYILRLTAKCNMNCPICLASANEYDEKDLTLDEIRSFIKGRKRLKLDLMGAEPTVRKDLEQIIRLASEKGHVSALHTNGIAIGNQAYFEKLVKAGLSEVHLQMDGFRDEDDLIIRGEPMGENKKRALASLKRFGVSTDLVVTVLKGVNEDQMVTVLDYARGHSFVKEVFFLGCRLLGRATEQAFGDNCMAPDELIDVLEEQTARKINREDIRIFQKLYFALLAFFKVRKCFYIHHYMVVRTKNGWEPVSVHMDLPYLEKRLDRFRLLLKKSRIVAMPYLAFHAVAAILKKGSFGLLLNGMFLSLMLLLGFDLSRIKRNVIILGFITACDPWNYDEKVAANCGKGEVANDQGINESGADANVGREHAHLQLKK